MIYFLLEKVSRYAHMSVDCLRTSKLVTLGEYSLLDTLFAHAAGRNDWDLNSNITHFLTGMRKNAEKRKKQAWVSLKEYKYLTCNFTWHQCFQKRSSIAKNWYEKTLVRRGTFHLPGSHGLRDLHLCYLGLMILTVAKLETIVTLGGQQKQEIY